MAFDKVTICNCNIIPTVECLETFFANAQDGGVCLEEDLVGGFDEFEATHCDVFLVVEAESDYVKYHCIARSGRDECSFLKRLCGWMLGDAGVGLAYEMWLELRAEAES